MGWGSIGKAFSNAVDSVKDVVSDTKDSIEDLTGSSELADFITDPVGSGGTLQDLMERPYDDFSEAADEWTTYVADALGIDTDSHMYGWMNDLSGLSINQGFYDSAKAFAEIPTSGSSDDMFEQLFKSQQTGTAALPGIDPTRDLANDTGTNPMPYLPMIASTIGTVVGLIYGDAAGEAAGASAALSIGIVFGEETDAEFVYMATLYAGLKSGGNMVSAALAELIPLERDVTDQLDGIVENILLTASASVDKINPSLYRRRSNIIGTGLRGLTIE